MSPPRPTTDPLWSVEDVANYLRVPVATIYQWRHRGTGPTGLKVGRHVRYRRADVEAWLNDRARAA